MANPVGRPPMPYDPEVGVNICVQLTDGEPLSRICKAEGMPSRDTVYKWLLESEEFSNMYAQARIDQADTLADEIIGLADEATSENAQAVRLQVDVRKWYAAKLRPKKYSDRIEHTGPEGGPMMMEHKLADLEPVLKRLQGNAGDA